MSTSEHRKLGEKRAPEGRSLRQSGVDVVWQLAQMVPVPLAPFTGGDPRRCTGLPRLDLRARPTCPVQASVKLGQPHGSQRDVVVCSWPASLSRGIVKGMGRNGAA